MTVWQKYDCMYCMTVLYDCMTKVWLCDCMYCMTVWQKYDCAIWLCYMTVWQKYDCVTVCTVWLYDKSMTVLYDCAIWLYYMTMTKVWLCDCMYCMTVWQKYDCMYCMIVWQKYDCAIWLYYVTVWLYVPTQSMTVWLYVLYDCMTKVWLYYMTVWLYVPLHRVWLYVLEKCFLKVSLSQSTSRCLEAKHAGFKVHHGSNRTWSHCMGYVNWKYTVYDRPYIRKVGQNLMYTPNMYFWWFPCRKCRICIVYILIRHTFMYTVYRV